MRALALLLAAGCGAATTTPRPAGHRVETSNVLRADYAGSRECGDCHAAIHDAWAKSPMRNMTRDLPGGDVRAPFDGEVFRFHDDRAVMTRAGEQRFMRLEGATGAGRTYRVTKVIGGRTREDFVGVDASGGEEQVLPVSWVFATASWRYKGYSVMLPERPVLMAGPVWRTSCIFCHNTVPYLSQVFDDLLAPGTRGYQGSVSDWLLPPRLLWRVEPRDAGALAGAVADEIAFLGGERPAAGTALDRLLRGARTLTRRRFDERHLVETGIGCEACHLGARAHADDPQIRPTFEVASPLLALRPPAGAPEPTRAERINHTCARCHTVLFSQYDWTWEGGHRDAATAGGSTINSGEARDFLLGACNQQLSCVACHDPHTRDPKPKLDALATVAGNATCTTCHKPLAAPEALARHAHHDAAGAGASCVACHMPKKNMGLDYTLTRYHRIGMPDDPVRVQNDRPLECALCHADKTVGEIVTTMERWWGKRYDRAALTRLYGSLDAVVLRATVERGLPHEQAVAATVLGEQRIRAAGSQIVPLLAHEYPLVRYFARRALSIMTGSEMTIDLDQPREKIVAEAQAWLAAH